MGGVGVAGKRDERRESERQRMASKSFVAFGFTVLLSLVLVSCHPPQPASPSPPAPLAAKPVPNDEKATKAIDYVCQNSTDYDVCVNVLKHDSRSNTEDRNVFLKILYENVRSRVLEIYSIADKLFPEETDPWSKDCLQACRLEYKMAQRCLKGITNAIDGRDYKRVHSPMMTIAALAYECQGHFDSPPNSNFGFGRTRISPFKEQNGLVGTLALTTATTAYWAWRNDAYPYASSKYDVM